MSLRQTAPKARLPDTHVFITFSRGDRAKCFALKTGTLYALAGALPIAAAIYFSTTAYLVFRDDMLSKLMSRQAEMQYSYEDRIAALRAQMDRVTSRQLLDQTSFEGKMHALLSRQAQLESRGSVVDALAAQAGLGDVTGALPAHGKPRRGAKEAAARGHSPNPLLVGAQRAAAPAGALAYVEEPAFASGKPAPLRSQESEAAPAERQRSSQIDPALSGLPVDEQLRRVAASLDTVETSQVSHMATLETQARAQAQGIRAAIDAAGLDADKLKAPSARAEGGPFVPLDFDRKGSAFERSAARFQDALIESDRLRRLMTITPLRAPLPPGAVQTSSFGARVDPFLGRMAMHTGLDFRGAVGEPARATAGGEVVTAGWTGGYGNMVEIDHGKGLATRYGHLSEIDVKVGEHVGAGAVIGKVGSTGRSTGPHLHYEVRINGEAVNPLRFLRAGAPLFSRLAVAAR